MATTISRNSESQKDKWVDITPAIARESSAHHIAQKAQSSAENWGSNSATLLTYAVGLWMFSYIYASVWALSFAAALISYKAADSAVKSPFAKPVTAAADIGTRLTASTTSLVTGTIAAQFEGENPAYRPSLGDVGKAVVKIGVTDLVFGSQEPQGKADISVKDTLLIV